MIVFFFVFSSKRSCLHFLFMMFFFSLLHFHLYCFYFLLDPIASRKSTGDVPRSQQKTRPESALETTSAPRVHISIVDRRENYISCEKYENRRAPTDRGEATRPNQRAGKKKRREMTRGRKDWSWNKVDIFTAIEEWQLGKGIHYGQFVSQRDNGNDEAGNHPPKLPSVWAPDYNHNGRFLTADTRNRPPYQDIRRVLLCSPPRGTRL